MTPTQSNVQKGGPIVAATATDLSGKEGLLAKAANVSGSLGVALPTAVDDLVPYLIVSTDSTEVEVLPLTTGDQYRVYLKGSCNPGDILELADPATAADAGKLVAGSTNPVAIAEETGVDGQLIKFRPL